MYFDLKLSNYFHLISIARYFQYLFSQGNWIYLRKKHIVFPGLPVHLKWELINH